jgi:hypothetical protein
MGTSGGCGGGRWAGWAVAAAGSSSLHLAEDPSIRTAMPFQAVGICWGSQAVACYLAVLSGGTPGPCAPSLRAAPFWRRCAAFHAGFTAVYVEGQM